MTTAQRKRKNQPSSCPTGWHPAGHTVPFRPTFKQAQYCRRAIGISRFVYNLCVATHRFHRTNRLPWPSWQDLNKEINAVKRTDFSFITTVHHRVRRGRRQRLRSRSQELERPRKSSRTTQVSQKTPHRLRLFQSRIRHSLNQVRRQTPHPTPRTGVPQTR